MLVLKRIRQQWYCSIFRRWWHQQNPPEWDQGLLKETEGSCLPLYHVEMEKISSQGASFHQRQPASLWPGSSHPWNSKQWLSVVYKLPNLKCFVTVAWEDPNTAVLCCILLCYTVSNQRMMPCSELSCLFNLPFFVFLLPLQYLGFFFLKSSGEWFCRICPPTQLDLSGCFLIIRFRWHVFRPTLRGWDDLCVHRLFGSLVPSSCPAFLSFPALCSPHFKS